MTKKLRGKNILVIDDEHRIRELIKMNLSKEGFEILEAGSGIEAKEQYIKYDPCFIILDINLPDMNGRDICQWLREELHSNVPIIILSAFCSEEERINGLRLGADDFLAKPFSHKELIVRIETVLRRTANRCSKLSYRGLTIKPVKGIAKFENHQIDLTHFEYQLLYLFMTNADQVLSREQIINLIYRTDEKMINDRTVDVHIKHLREKIRKYSDYPFIQTVRGMGYIFTV